MGKNRPGVNCCSGPQLILHRHTKIIEIGPNEKKGKLVSRKKQTNCLGNSACKETVGM